LRYTTIDKLFESLKDHASEYRSYQKTIKRDCQVRQRSLSLKHSQSTKTVGCFLTQSAPSDDPALLRIVRGLGNYDC